MIVDVFPINDELDMLECRMYELKGLVDLFIAVEANATFTGIPKPYHVSDNISRYDGYPLEVVQCDYATAKGGSTWAGASPETRANWYRDGQQRDAAMDLLNDLPEDALMIYGDLDEIPRRGVLEQATGDPAMLVMDMLIYSCKWAFPGPWGGSVIGLRKALPRPSVTRNNRGAWNQIWSSGWHLSWFGKAADRERKLRDFSHQEMVPQVSKTIGAELPKRRLHVDGKTRLVPWEGDLPAWIGDGLAPDEWYSDFGEEA